MHEILAAAQTYSHLFDEAAYRIGDRLHVGEHIWVKFDGMEPLVAAVCWVEGFTTGVEFQTPIHPAVFELLLARLAADTLRQKCAGASG